MFPVERSVQPSTRSRSRNDPTAVNEQTPLLESFPSPKDSRTPWFWPSFLSKRLSRSAQPGAGLAANDAGALERNEQEVDTKDDAARKKTAVVGFFIVLYFGVWIASADLTMVFTVYNTISSDLGRFQDAMWIVTAYQLGEAPAQPLYGKLSDIFGHKAMFTVAYTLFGIGCIICGLSSSLPSFAAGRVVAGIGGAGMRSLVSSLIVHFVPLRDVAVWRSWMYAVATFGRSTGAPLGGMLTDLIGWRASFVYQVPLVVLALALVWWKLPTGFEHDDLARQGILSKNGRQTMLSKLRRIDFPGAFLIATSIVTFLLILNLASKNLTLIDPLTLGLIPLWVISSLLFLLVESRYAAEPIFPLRLLLERDVLTAYLIIGFISASHLSVFSSVALYFRVTERASNTIASLHLLPSIVGNTVGSLITGWAIRRTGRYRYFIILAPVCSIICFILMYFRWGNPPIATFESIYIALSGFSNAVTISAVFVFLSAATRKEDTAVASGAFYLAMCLGEVTGVALQNSIFQGTLRQVLPGLLREVEHSNEIIRQVTSSVSNIWLFPSDIQKIVIDTYVQGFTYTYLLSLGCAVLALILSTTVREYSLDPR